VTANELSLKENYVAEFWVPALIGQITIKESGIND
jgi:hypothetical protein